MEAGIQKPKRKRAKTGCLNCRKKHKKCDEVKPRCTTCSKKSELCEWPGNQIRFSKTITPPDSIETSSQKNDRNLDQYANRLLSHLNEKSDNTLVESGKSSNITSMFASTYTSDQSGSERTLRSEVNQHSNKNPDVLTELINGTEKQNKSPQLSPNNANEIEANVDSILNNRQHLNSNGNNDNFANKAGSLSFESSLNPSNNRAHDVNAVFSPNSMPSNNNLQGSNIDCSPTSLGDRGDSYFSPSDSLTPFLLYNELHSTLRDFMFTSAELNEITTTADFNNIWEAGPTLLARDASNNLQELLNKSTGDLTKTPNTDIMTMANHGNTKVSNILKSYKTELTAVEELELFKNYLYEVAPWLDMFDSSRQFGTTVADLAQNNKPLLYAVYAISSRQKELTEPNFSAEKSMKLYQESLKHLIPTVNKTVDQGIITTCVILCVLEMMSSSPKEWRHHLEGCHALFEANDIHGFSGDLERRLFWCYARMDVNSAVIGEQSTIIPSENWLGKNCSIYDSKQLFLKTKDDDMYANYIVFLCSRVLNLISKEYPDFEKEWEILWDEVSDWCLNRPVNLKPIMSFDDKPFPGILFLNGPAISANQLFHMAIILLATNKPRLYKIKPSEYIKSTIWHAKQICAISIHNTHHGCWNNSLQPLWIAGKLLSGDHEHEIILNLLDKIEATTGWQMKFRKKDLKKYWSGLLVE